MGTINGPIRLIALPSMRFLIDMVSLAALPFSGILIYPISLMLQPYSCDHIGSISSIVQPFSSVLIELLISTDFQNSDRLFRIRNKFQTFGVIYGLGTIYRI